MPLREDLAGDGAWLFKHRSYLPLLGLGLVLSRLPRFTYLGDSHGTQLLWEALCLAIGLSGLAIRVHVGGHAPSGASTRGTSAPRASILTTTGLYSVVRHPLYLANVIMWLSVTLFVHRWLLTLLMTLGFWLYLERIMLAEEEMLRARFGAAWLEWAARTPAFVPNPRLWRPSEYRFSLRKALRREYAAFFALIATFTGLEVVADFMVTGRLRVDLVWGALFAISLGIFLVFRWLTHHTRVLDVPELTPITEPRM